jgi:hypothetical protein
MWEQKSVPHYRERWAGKMAPQGYIILELARFAHSQIQDPGVLLASSCFEWSEAERGQACSATNVIPSI